MSNIKRDSITLNTSKNEWALTGADLLKEENQGFLDEVCSLGEGKGIPFTFKKDEVITFDPFEETILVKRTVTFRDEDYAVLNVLAESNFRRTIEIPLSIFRRIPALEEDRKKLFDKFPLSEELAQGQLGDLGRIKILAGSTIEVSGVFMMLRQTFTRDANGRFTRDSEEVVKTKGEYLTCYQVKTL